MHNASIQVQRTTKHCQFVRWERVRCRFNLKGSREVAMVLRKQIIDVPPAEPDPAYGEIPIATMATVCVTSEAVDHPIDHIFDVHRGRGGTRWIAQTPGEQMVVLAFDAPQVIRSVVLEIEESEASRTEQLSLQASFDGGQNYREVVRQEFTFSPPNTTFQREQWIVSLEQVTQLRLTIKPDKGQHDYFATITSLILY